MELKLVIVGIFGVDDIRKLSLEDHHRIRHVYIHNTKGRERSILGNYR